MARPDQNHSIRIFRRLVKGLALPRQKAVDLTKRGRGVLKVSMKFVQQLWARSEKRKGSMTLIHAYEIRPRTDKHGFDLMSDALRLSPLWYSGPNAISNAIRFAKFHSRSHDAVIRVYDDAGNVIETYEQTRDLYESPTSASTGPAAPSSATAKSASAETAIISPAPGGGDDLVWVNTEKHVYHKEGSRFYGTTKKGKYITEREAIQTGNKAARLGRADPAMRYNRSRKVPQAFTSRRDSRLRRSGQRA
jgi:hypothetical protein